MIPQKAAVDLSRTPQLAFVHGKPLVLESSSQIQRRARLRYLFAVSAVVPVVGVDSRPWRYGEQHFFLSAVSGAARLTSVRGSSGGISLALFFTI